MTKQLPTGWKMVKLGDLCHVKGGKRLPKGDTFVEAQTKHPYIRVVDMVGGSVNLNNIKYISDITHASISRYTITKDDVYISIAGTIGSTGIIPECLDGANLTENAAKLVIKKPNTLNKHFLANYLQTPYCQSLIAIRTNAVGVPKLALERISTIEIPVPPLEAQHKIVSILDEADNLRKLRKQADDKMKEFIPALFDEMFGDPVTNHKGWSYKKFGDAGIAIIDGDRGSNYPQKQDFTDQGYCLFLNTKNVRPSGFRFDECDFISREKDESLRKGKLQRHDVVLTTRGTVGNVSYYDDRVPYDNIRINSGMVILRPNRQIFDPKYVSLLLQTHYIRNQFELISSGCAQPQLPIRSLITLNVPLHPIELQREFVDKVALAEAEYQRQSSSRNKLDDLFNSLMDRCMSGQI